MPINDQRFMAGTARPKTAKSLFNQRGVNRSELVGIGDKQGWELNKLAERIGVRDPVSDNDPLPAGTPVEFKVQDKFIHGKVASKSGQDYIVEVQPGESYLISAGKLSKTSKTREVIQSALRAELAPEITVLGGTTGNPMFVTVAYTIRRPSDDFLTNWAGQCWADHNLVDVLSGSRDRELRLVLEAAAPPGTGDGGDQNIRGIPLSTEEMPGTGVAETPITADDQQIQHKISPNAIEVLDPLWSRMQNMGVPPDHITELKSGVTNYLTQQSVSNIDQAIVGITEYLDRELLNEIADDGRLEKDISTFMRWLRERVTNERVSHSLFVMGMEDVSDHLAQLEGEPGYAEQFADLDKAARWVLSRFNDSNPDYFAAPLELQTSGGDDNRVVRLSFSLSKKDDQGNLRALSEGGKAITGFVQVDSQGNLPTVMLEGANGPESVQQSGFKLSAHEQEPFMCVNCRSVNIYKVGTAVNCIDCGGTMALRAQVVDDDICKKAADEVLANYCGYCDEAQAEFEARLTKFAVDDKTKGYWKSYFGQYGKMLTRDVPRKHHESSLARIAVIKKEKGKYCVKSPKNPDWSGGCYESKEDAEKRLQQVEMFKHMSSQVMDEDTVSSHAALIAYDIVHGDYKVFKDAQTKQDKQKADSREELANLLFSKAIKGDVGAQEAVGKAIIDYLSSRPAWIAQPTSVIDNELKGKIFSRSLRENPSLFKELSDKYNKAEETQFGVKPKKPGILQRMFGPKQETKTDLGLDEQSKDQAPAAEQPAPSATPEPPPPAQPQADPAPAAPSPEVPQSQAPATPEPKPESKPAPAAPKLQGNILDWKPGSGKYKDIPVRQILDYEPKYVYDQLIPRYPEMQNELMGALKEWMSTHTKPERKLKEKTAPKAPKEPKPTTKQKSPGAAVNPIKKNEPPPVEKPKPKYFGSQTKPEDIEGDIAGYRIPAGTMKGQTLGEAANKDPKMLRNYITSFNPALMPMVEELMTKPKGASMTTSKTADAGPMPFAHNVPGKDDKKDYDYKERNKPPSKFRARFSLTRVYSTASTNKGAGYLMMEIGWNPKDFAGVGKYTMGNHVVSYVKGLESDKYHHDFGVLGKPHIIEMDQDAGVARVKVRSSQSCGVPTLTYTSDMYQADPMPTWGVR